jgi:N-acetylglucosaminyldiphosphoundecaprenol N-acetyl-beta-D-mannosaminyltransferase
VEWLYCFATEPHRLFTRYFVEPWSLIGPALTDLGGR